MKNFILLSLIVCQSVFAIPSLINYQGRLVDPNGEPLTGNKSMSVSIYDAVTNGSSLYTEDVGEVTLDGNGIYSFSFGTNETDLASALQTTGEHWLELTVNGSAQTPRERVLSVPFARLAWSLAASVVIKTNTVSGLYHQPAYYPHKWRALPMTQQQSNENEQYLCPLELKPGSILREAKIAWEASQFASIMLIEKSPDGEVIEFDAIGFPKTSVAVADGIYDCVFNREIKMDCSYYFKIETRGGWVTPDSSAGISFFQYIYEEAQ